MIEKLEYFKYTPQTNTIIDSEDPANNSEIIPDQKKGYKIQVRSRMVYKFELFYYTDIIFVKFYPSILERSADKYSRSNIGLTLTEIRKLLNTCCKIVHLEMNKKENEDKIYAFIGQWYSKDNQLKRFYTIRYSIYLKQTANVFFEDIYHHNWFETLNLYCLSKAKYEMHSKKVSDLLHYLAASPSLLMSFLTEEGKNRLINEFPDTLID